MLNKSDAANCFVRHNVYGNQFQRIAVLKTALLSLLLFVAHR